MKKIKNNNLARFFFFLHSTTSFLIPRVCVRVARGIPPPSLRYRTPHVARSPQRKNFKRKFPFAGKKVANVISKTKIMSNGNPREFNNNPNYSCLSNLKRRQFTIIDLKLKQKIFRKKKHEKLLNSFTILKHIVVDVFVILK